MRCGRDATERCADVVDVPSRASSAGLGGRIARREVVTSPRSPRKKGDTSHTLAPCGERGENLRLAEALVGGTHRAGGGVTLVHGGLRRGVSLGGIISLGLGANLEALSLRALREGALSERTDAAECALAAMGLEVATFPAEEPRRVSPAKAWVMAKAAIVSLTL